MALYIPDMAPARTVTASVDGAVVAQATFPGPGNHVLRSEPISLDQETATVEISVDATFSAAGDRRELGLILSGAGFR